MIVYLKWKEKSVYFVILFLKARQQVYVRSQLAKRQVDLDDIVLEEAIPDIG